MQPLLHDIRHNPLLWLLVCVPVVFAAEHWQPGAHTLLFLLSVLAIVPLAALLSHATESVAAKTGDTVGGLLNATLGNLTELVIALAALRAGQYMLVKASIAGAIVTNTLFMLGASFLLGGLKHHMQEYNRHGARFQAALLFLATVLARRGGDDGDRHDDRRAGDQQWPCGMVRGRPAADGVCDLRPDAVPLTASGAMTPVLRIHALLIALDENAPSGEKRRRLPPMPQRDFGTPL